MKIRHELIIFGIFAVIKANSECVCTRELKPVCGSDGQTYSNRCMATCHGASVIQDHPCDGQEEYLVSLGEEDHQEGGHQDEHKDEHEEHGQHHEEHGEQHEEHGEHHEGHGQHHEEHGEHHEGHGENQDGEHKDESHHEDHGE